MAVWGKGDPRWLVEHREDGKNVNAWHWSEVNKMEWTKQRLSELLPGLEVPGDGGAAGGGTSVGAGGVAGWSTRVTSVKSVTGEAMLTTRKGNKRFAFYDLKLTLGWEAAPLAPQEGERAADAGGEPAAVVGSAGDGGPEGVTNGAAAAHTGEDLDAAAEGKEKTSAAAAADGAGVAAVVSGEITVGEFGSGSDHEDLQVTVTATGGKEESVREALKRHAEAALWPLVLQRLEQYVKELGEA